MEEQTGSIKKLIRIHLNAYKKCIQQRKYTESINKNCLHVPVRKTLYKSPDVKIRLTEKENN